MKSNPTRASPSSFGNLHSNSAQAGVSSQRREVTTGDGGARWRQSGRRHVSAQSVGQAPKHDEALGEAIILLRIQTWLGGGDRRSDWWSHLDKMADNIDR